MSQEESWFDHEELASAAAFFSFCFSLFFLFRKAFLLIDLD